MLFFLLCVVSTHSKTYIEEPFDSIRFLPNVTAKDVSSKMKYENGYVMEPTEKNVPSIKFNNTNPYEEWSFEFTISNFDFTFPEEGGVYMWYTNSESQKGTFDGCMAGIEFKGKNPEIIFALNDGTQKDIDNLVTRDHFNYKRLEGVRELTVKIIVTKNNFKVELYDGSNLLYDSLRILYDHPFSNLGTGKKFSITTFYNNLNRRKFIKITKAQLNSRKELDSYNPEQVHTDNMSKLKTYEDESNYEVRHAIAQFTHYIEYFKAMFGGPDHPTLVVNSKNILKNLEEIEKLVKDRNVESGNPVQNILGNKLNEMDLKLQLVQKSISNLDHFVKDFKRQQNTKTSHLAYLIVGIGISILLFYFLNEIKNRSYTKTNK